MAKGFSSSNGDLVMKNQEEAEKRRTRKLFGRELRSAQKGENAKIAKVTLDRKVFFSMPV